MDEKEETKTPEISIVIPAYNRERFIAPLFNCLKNQTFQDFECIIIDDGSTDNTGGVCDSLARDDKRFVVRHIRHGGVSRARNLGLDLAIGCYLTFIDSDDTIPNNYLEKLYGNIKKFNVDIVVGSIYKHHVVDNSLKKIEIPYEERVYDIAEIMEDFAVYQKNTGILGTCVAKIFPRTLVSDIRFDESLSLAEDFDFYIKLFQKIKKVYFDNTCEYGYFDVADNSSTCVDDDDIDYVTQLKIQLRYKEFLETKSSFYGTNRSIVSDQIRNYIYFSIYHCNLFKFNSTFQTVRELYLHSGVGIENSFRFKGFILKCVHQNHRLRLWIAMMIYKLGRKILKGH